MVEDVVIEPMNEEFIVWRCLHDGPLSSAVIDQWPPLTKMPWSRYRKRNLPLLTKLTRIYGACAIVARDRDKIIGLLRFYPKAVYDLAGCGRLCLQQDYPSGPVADFADRDFPDPAQIQDKTLAVHCLMTGSPLQEENPYQRKGIATRMVRALIKWAQANGWERIECEAFEDLPIVYAITGCAGHTFWEKLGFHLIDRHPHPDLQDRTEFTDFISTLEEQAATIGLAPEAARDRLVMRLDLT